MGIWDSLRRFTRRTPDGRGGIQKKARGRGKKGSKRRDLRLEQFEDRVLLSITPGLMDDMYQARMLEASIASAADLQKYDVASLDTTDQWVVGLVDGKDPASLAIALGGDSIGDAYYLPGATVWEFSALVGWEEVDSRLGASDDVSYYYPLVKQQLETKFIPNDPLFADQWHLQNTGQSGGTAGVDSNLVSAWDLIGLGGSAIRGEGVIIGIVDTGIEHAHPDLIANYRADLSWDFNFNDPDPMPDFSGENHGTAVAGVAAAVGDNSTGVSGSAPGAEWAGLRLIAGPSSDLDQAQALFYQPIGVTDAIDIYSNSWGPADGFFYLVGPGPQTALSIQDGVTNGRGGLGNIYTWAGGNGLQFRDDVNYDGYANSRYTIAVGAINHDGVQSWYSEPGASLLVVAPSNGLVSGITTTDRVGAEGYNSVAGAADGDPQPDLDYTSTFGGTSSSTPLVSGVVALMLEANPNLSYRDVQHILVETSTQTDPTDADWVQNAAGYWVNHKYGHGAIDAAAAVQEAITWESVDAEVRVGSGPLAVGIAIPDNDPVGVSQSVTLDDSVGVVEWVEVTFSASHASPGDIEITLISPSGTRSVLTEAHTDFFNTQYNNWTLTTNRNWGEFSEGTWTLEVRDAVGNGVGTFDSWELNVFGQQFGQQGQQGGPLLVAVIPNDDDILKPGDVLNIGPRELLVRFNEGQMIDANSLDGIQVIRAGGDGGFDVLENGSYAAIANPTDQLIDIGWIGIGDNPNEVIIRFAETLPDDLYRLVIVGADDYVSIGTTAVQVTAPNGDLLADGMMFRLGDGDKTFVFEFEDVTLGDDVAAGHVPVPFNPAESALDIASAIANAINTATLPGANLGDPPLTLNVTAAANGAIVTLDGPEVVFLDQTPGGLLPSRVAPTGPLTNQFGRAFNETENETVPFTLNLGAQTVAVVPQPIVDDGSGWSQKRDQIEVYFNDDELDSDAAANVNFYQIIVTQNTATPDDDVAILPVSVNYDAAANKATLIFAQDLAEYRSLPDQANNEVIALRLRIGNEYRPIGTTRITSPDAGSSFHDAQTLTSLGNLGAGPQSLIVSAAIDPQSYRLEWPGAIDEPGHRDLPNQPALLVEDHLMSGESAPDGVNGITTQTYSFPDIYGFDLNGAPLTNGITGAQMDRTREIFQLYGDHLGVSFVEVPASQGQHLVVTGNLVVFGETSGPGGIAGMGGGGLVVMDDAENWGSSEFGGSWFRVAMHEIGHNLGFGHTYDLNPVTIMGSSIDSFNQPGSSEAVFPGDHDIVHGLHMYRPDSIDIDLYEFTLEESGMFSAEIFAERQDDSSLLDSTLTLYRMNPATADQGPSYDLLARNDDFYSEDSFLEVYLQPGTYFVGVTASGNNQYDPNIENTGIGGTSQGKYDLRLDFEPGGVDPDVPETFRGDGVDHMIDATGVLYDGDADGVPGGVYNFWFNVQSETHTLFVDKLADPAVADGSLANPYHEIDVALGEAEPGDIVRILGNNFANDDPDDDASYDDNVAYEIGKGQFNIPTKILADGKSMEIPQGVTVMIDAGAVFKLRDANIDVGSSSEGIDRSGGALQILGTPEHSVIFTSYHDETIGNQTDTEPQDTAPMEGDWGGLVFRNNLDYDFIDAYGPAQRVAGVPARAVLETQGIFLNYVNHADIRYGGGTVFVDSVESAYAPIHLFAARPTVSFNTITNSADAAVSADPDSFADTKFQNWDPTSPFTADYQRVGPDVHGNLLKASYRTDPEELVETHINSINGLFVRIVTEPGMPINEMELPGRFDDWDMPHVISQALFINGTPGGPVRNAATNAMWLLDESRIQARSGGVITDGDTFSLFDGATRVVFEFTLQGDGVIPGRIPIEYLPADGAVQVAASIAAAIQSVSSANPLNTSDLQLDIDAQVDAGAASIVELLLRGPTMNIGGFATDTARLDARLMIDPGVIVKLDGARIEVEIGAQLIAEGRAGATEGAPGYQVVFTSLLDNRYGAGGTFDTAENTSNFVATPGIWTGLYFNPVSEGSIDHAVIAYAGGITTIEGALARFNPVEIRQANVRITNSRFEENAANSQGGDRSGRGGTSPATIFVRGAQPIIVGNDFINNQGPIISINANALNSTILPDWGRSTGWVSDFHAYADNAGPMIRANRMTNNDLNGMEIRGATLTTESIWDDTDIVHVLYDEMIVPNYHVEGGLRLESAPSQSLVIKLDGANAGFTALGRPLEIDDRIGGTLQVVGMPGFPVVMTSLADDSVGAGFDLRDRPQFDTNNNTVTLGEGQAGDWRSIKLDRYSNDRNVALINEQENPFNVTIDANSFPDGAQELGALAPFEKAGDDNLRLGFEIHGVIRQDDPDDVDVYSFQGTAGTEVWIDLDKTTHALDTILELINANGDVIARSDNSVDELTDADVFGDSSLIMDRDDWLRNSPSGVSSDFYTTNQRDAGMRVILPGPEGAIRTYFIRVRSALAIGQIPSSDQISEGQTFAISDGTRTLTFEWDSDGDVGDADPDDGMINVRVLFDPTTTESSSVLAARIRDTINLFAGFTGMDVKARLLNGNVVLDGPYVSFNPGDSPLAHLAKGSGSYQLQLRLKEMQEIPGSIIQFADIRYATNGIEVYGQPGHSPLLGESFEVANNNTRGAAQDLGNLLGVDRNAIAVSGYLDDQWDVDWYEFQVDYQGVQQNFRDIWSTIIDVDYADGMSRPDLSAWLFDSSGKLILIGHDSNVVDDRSDPNAQGVNLDDLDRGSPGAGDPYIGSAYLPEGDGETYYLAITSRVAVAEVVRSSSNPLTRLEPVDSVNRIVEEHIESGAISGIPVEMPRLTLTPDEFHLGDVVMYVGTRNDLYTVDPFTGAVETDITGTGRLPSNRYHGTFAIRNDGRLYELTGNAGSQAGEYRQLDWGTGGIISNVSPGIQAGEVNPAAPTAARVDANGGIDWEAMTHTSDKRFVVAVGNTHTTGIGVTYTNDLLYILDDDGRGIQYPNATGGPRLTSDIIPRGQLLAGTTLFAVDATDTVPAYADNRPLGALDGIPDDDIRDGTSFALTDTGGTTVAFEFDSGPDVHMDSTGPAAVRDGENFTITEAGSPTSTTYTFEFNSGPVLVVGDGSAVIADGSQPHQFTIADASGLDAVTFEYVYNVTDTLPGNFPIVINSFDLSSAVAQKTRDAINAAASVNPSFGVVADVNPFAQERVTIINDASIDLTGAQGVVADGDYVTAGAGVTAIPFEETWPNGTFGGVIEAVVEGQFNNLIDVGYAERLGTQAQLGPFGDRLTFLSAIAVDFDNVASFTHVAGAWGLPPSTVRIPFTADMTQREIALAVELAVNTVDPFLFPGFNVLATAGGGTVSFTNLNSVETANLWPLEFRGVGAGGGITGITYIGNQLYAVSSNGGLYEINNEFGRGFVPRDPQNAPKYIAPVFGSAPSLDFITQVSHDGQPIQFSGLSTGPQNVEGGIYSDLLFATDISGNIYAMNTAGELQPLFLDGEDSVSTGIFGARGVDFSNIDYNLWHTTNFREDDAGHGVETTFDNSRISFNDFRREGKTSYYFGLEDPRLTTTISPQPGASNYIQTIFGNNPVDTNDEAFRTYDMPGGALGSLTTGAFSLEGYSRFDKPTVYFTYYAETQGGSYDTFRVFVSNDGADWNTADITAATMDSQSGGYNLGRWNARPDDMPNYSPRYANTFDIDRSGGSWRQIIIDLSNYAGMDDLQLRFDFSTAGDTEVGDPWTTGQYLTAVPGSKLTDGRLPGGTLPDGTLSTVDSQFTIETTDPVTNVTIDVRTFEFDMGYALFIPNTAGATIADGESFTVNDGVGAPITFEFVKPGGATSGVPIYIDDGMTTQEVIDRVIAAVNGAGLFQVTPFQVDSRVFLIGAAGVTQSSSPAVLLLGDAPGTVSPGAIAVPVRGDMTATQVATVITNVVNQYYAPGVTNYETAIKRDPDLGNLMHLIGHEVPHDLWASVDAAGPLGFGPEMPGETDLRNNNITSNTQNHFTQNRRGQDNHYEGIYIDDIIIGFAERGEMVTSAATNVTGFNIPASLVEQVVTTGEYSFEIRRGEEYGVFNPIRRLLGITNTLDTNERLAEDITIIAPAAMDIAHGDEFFVDDGLRVQRFVFWDAALGGGGSTDGVVIYFNARQVDSASFGMAELIATAISNVEDFDVTATSIPTSQRVDLFGAVEVTGLNRIRYGVGSGVGVIDTGDTNLHREKGQIILAANSILYSQEYGIRVEPASRDSSAQWPHPASGLTVNAPNRLVPGLMIENNLVAFSGLGGILFSGETGAPLGAIPFGRIINNTIYGTPGQPTGFGIEVRNNASPTLLNNIVANTNDPILIDGSSSSTVLAGTFYQGNNPANQPPLGVVLADFERAIDVDEPLFVNPDAGNFYLAFGSEAIDSSINSLEERQNFYNQILEPMGIPVSPIIAPDFDLYGNLRIDDPDVSSAPGLGGNVFKDRGAFDRVDREGPIATVINPMDNEIGVDRLFLVEHELFVVGLDLTAFSIQLSDSGTKIDDSTVADANGFVLTGVVTLLQDGLELTLGANYFAYYDAANDVIHIVPAAGVWEEGSKYTIQLNNDPNSGIRDIAGNPLQPNRAATGATEFNIMLSGYDYGDLGDNLPVPPGGPQTALNFRSLESNDGAKHIVYFDYHLGDETNGPGVDTESDALHNITATGDRFDDGVSFEGGSLLGNEIVKAEIIVTAGQQWILDPTDPNEYVGYVNAWFDFNRDGTFDATELAVDSLPVANGVNSVNIDIPAMPTGPLYARFRFGSEENVLSYGEAADGEVEDYMFQVVEFRMDFGDAPSPYPVTLADSGASHKIETGLYMGLIEPDSEADGLADPDALGDDLLGVPDDEDALDSAAVFFVLGNNTPDLTIDVVNRDPSNNTIIITDPAYLSAWVDFNNDGDWDDAGEQVISDHIVFDGVNTVPVSTAGAIDRVETFARFRISRSSGLLPTGVADDGEVEDYKVFVVDAVRDFGDAPGGLNYPTLFDDNGASHVLGGMFLGQLVDPEFDGLPDLVAEGDDLDSASGANDEDGVEFLGRIVPGEEATISVQVSNSTTNVAYLNAWLDFNGDGDWDDDGEQIFAALELDAAASPHTLTFQVPDLQDPLGDPDAPYSIIGDTFARFRLGTDPNLAVAGATGLGEVEDYLATIVIGDATIEGRKFNDFNANGAFDATGAFAVEPIELVAPGPVLLTDNDDMVTGPLSLGFTFEFYGKSYQEFYVSNNGAVSFGQATPFPSGGGFPQGTPMLAPFWADVDTRDNAGDVRMAQGITDQGNPFVQIDWVQVGYYNRLPGPFSPPNLDYRNNFTLYMEDQPGGDIVSLVYRDMEWTTGDTGGIDGFGGTGAEIGINAGDFSRYISEMRPSTPTDLDDLMAIEHFDYRFDPTTGVPNAGEPGVAGVMIYLDSQTEGTPGQFDPALEQFTFTQADNPTTTNLDETGMYEFTDLFPGQYVVREVVPDDWSQTFPNTAAYLPEPGSYYLKAVDGADLGDGQTFSLTYDVTTLNFELEDLTDPALADGVALGAIEVSFTDTDTADVVAASIAAAINDAIALLPVGTSFPVTASINGNVLDVVLLDNDAVVVDTGTTSMTLVGPSFADIDANGEGYYEVFLQSAQTVSGVDFGNNRIARVSLGDVVIAEGNQGLTEVQVEVRLTGSFGAPVEVTYSTADGTATSTGDGFFGDDYVPVVDGTFTFVPQGQPLGTWDQRAITRNDSNDYDYHVSGSSVVFEHFDGNDWEIFVYNHTLGEEPLQITNNLTDDRLATIFQYEDPNGDQQLRMAWTGADNGGGDDLEIFYSQGPTTDLAQLRTNMIQITNNDFDDKSPQVSESLVAWWGGDVGSREIYTWDPVVGGFPTNISNSVFDDLDPRISGSNVVWFGGNGVARDIYVYSNGATSRLTNNGDDNFGPQIDGDYIVWQRDDNQDVEIYLHNLASGLTTAVTNNDVEDINPQVSDGVIVWESGEGIGKEIFLFSPDFGGTPQNISNNLLLDETPQIHGNRVVWHTAENSDWEVYYYEVGQRSISGNISNNDEYDWGAQVSDQLVVWRTDDGQDFEVIVAVQNEPEIIENITLYIKGDIFQELDEDFSLRITAVTLGSFDPTPAIISVLNDDGDLDFGDAPASYGTLLADNGARHMDNGSGLYLGSGVDYEADGQPGANATLDDLRSTLAFDDEDGLLFDTPWAAGSNAQITLIASAAGLLDAWADFNADGDWDDDGEQIFNAQPLVAGPNSLSVFVPVNAWIGDTFTRFRFSQTGGLAPTGSASGGEVEDHQVSIVEGTPIVLLQGSLQGSTVIVNGSAGDDFFAFSYDTPLLFVLQLNGKEFEFTSAEVSQIVFNGRQGVDVISIRGSENDETFTWKDGIATLDGGGLLLVANGMESVSVVGGGGQGDLARLTDSPGDDQLNISPQAAVLRGPGYSVQVGSFPRIKSYARNGGTDQVVFSGSADTETFVAGVDTAAMSNALYSNWTRGFESVLAVAKGPNDRANLKGSSTSDTFVGMAGQSRFYGTATAFDVTVRAFDHVIARATPGGDDKAELYDSPGDDVFVADSLQARMYGSATPGTNYEITARLFRDVKAIADQGGDDVAELYDSIGDNLWEVGYSGGQTWSSMSSETRTLYEALAFEQVHGYGVNGGDNSLRKDIPEDAADFVLQYGDWDELN